MAWGLVSVLDRLVDGLEGQCIAEYRIGMRKASHDSRPNERAMENGPSSKLLLRALHTRKTVVVKDGDDARVRELLQSTAL
ncbi:hypothetical protein DXG03_005562 [Asterophora parasitica]|uniref:Uncharacterized protein n=1 Tax=Asterophora parasitica TaxID=117018 RepID=A0A9P7G393_9AGAR|nr:hypothetical protein DXG03_005562 [Asterophora parasitica]